MNTERPEPVALAEDRLVPRPVMDVSPIGQRGQEGLPKIALIVAVREGLDHRSFECGVEQEGRCHVAACHTVICRTVRPRNPPARGREEKRVQVAKLIGVEPRVRAKEPREDLGVSRLLDHDVVS
jgi:hypothetical protein